MALTGYYLFDKAKEATITSTVKDSSGNGLNLTENGFAGDNTEYVAGVKDHAVTLNGSSKYLTASANTVHDQTTNDFSIAGWIYRTSDSGAIEVIVAKRNPDSGINPGYRIVINASDQISADISDTSVITTTTSTTTISTATWYFVAVVYDRDGNCTIYINGTQDGTPQSIIDHVSTITSTETFTVGRASNASAQFFPGRIDDLRVYNHALTANEVSELYNKALITISKNNGTDYIEMRNFTGLTTDGNTPTDAINDITAEADDAILIKLLGPSMQIGFDWVITTESTTVTLGSDTSTTTAVDQYKYLYDTLTSQGEEQITDTYTITLYFGAGVSLVRRGAITKIYTNKTPDEALSFNGHIDFLVGTVV